MLRTRWAAVGAAVAITLGAGGVSLTDAAISSGEKPVFVSLDAPCRVLDTRGGPKIGAAASIDVQITGANGDCTGALAIPADAVGVATNVTVIQPSDAASGRSYFTVHPTGATRPGTSNLNFVNGQAPTPNKVDVGIGTGGKITIYNNEGTAHAAVDIFGYYIDHHHDDRYYTKAEVDTAIEERLAGTIVRGAVNLAFYAPAPLTEGAAAISFGVDLPSPPTVHIIRVGQTPPSGCSGTSEAPSAQAGHLCVFQTFTGIANIDGACIARTAPTYDCGLSNTWSASLVVTSVTNGAVRFVGSWALGVPDLAPK